MMRLQGGCLFAIALAIAGCNDEAPSVAPPAINESHRQIIERSNKLALDIYGELRKSPGNLVLSPYGVSASLAMLLAGAAKKSTRRSTFPSTRNTPFTRRKANCCAGCRRTTTGVPIA
jgi:serine protease inhibitor